MHQAHSEFIRKYSKNCLLSYRHTWFKILSVNFFPSPLDVIFEEGLNHLQPDLIFIILVFKSLCVFIFQNSVKSSLPGGKSAIIYENQYKKENMGIFQEQGWIHGVPNLLIEIISKGTFTRDTEEKFEIYQKYGVSEYWLVFPELHCIEVFTLENALYSLYCSTEKTDGKVFSKLLTGLEIDSRLIFG